MSHRPTFFLALIVLPLIGAAQFALEHTYLNAGTPGSQNQLYMVDLEDIGKRYVFFNKAAKSLTFFDLSHVQTQVIDLSAVPDDGVVPGRQVLYITQYLFDLDAGVELMYLATGGIGGASLMTSIVDEDGTIIQSFPEEAGYVMPNYPQSHFPIYETSDGAKMVLSHQANLQAKVYALPGHLPMGMAPLGTALPTGNVKVYPNPASAEVRFEVTGVEAYSGLTLRVFDQGGQMVLQRNVDAATFLIQRGSLSAGHYVYTVAQGAVVLASGSFIFE